MTTALSACHGEEGPRGRQLYWQRCSQCHATTTEPRQGPGLAGVVGRKAGSVPGFPYTPQLKSSGLAWDRKMLDRFLTNPSAVVPGTLMPMMVPDPKDRQDIIDFLETLKPPSPDAATNP
jgi:cytochrome c